MTQAAGNEQELARAENQLRAMLSPDTPAPSSAEVRAMRKKIADLKNPFGWRSRLWGVFPIEFRLIRKLT